MALDRKGVVLNVVTNVLPVVCDREQLNLVTNMFCVTNVFCVLSDRERYRRTPSTCVWQTRVVRWTRDDVIDVSSVASRSVWRSGWSKKVGLVTIIDKQTSRHADRQPHKHSLRLVL